MPLSPIALYQCLARRRHGPRVFRAALALQLAWLSIQLAVCHAVLRWCPPLGPLAYRRVMALTATARRYRQQCQYLMAEL